MNELDIQTEVVRMGQEAKEEVRYDTGRVLDDVWAERKAQDAKWGEQNHDAFTWGMILMEEVGEASEAALHNMFTPFATTDHDALQLAHEARIKHLRDELVQVAAVAVAWIESLDREDRSL